MLLPFRALALVTLLLSLWTPAFPAEGGSSSWGDREQLRYSTELQTLQQKEQAAIQAQQKAVAARQYAARIADHQALPVAERALDTARRALKKIRSDRKLTEERLTAVNKLRSTKTGDQLAVASSLQGTVQIQTDTGWIRLTPDTLLKPGQEIRTGVDGAAEILFNDGSRIQLQTKTDFLLEREDDSVSNYRLALGRIRAQINRLGQRRYKVRTPTAICGVRGTEFLLETTGTGASALVVLRGVVEFGPVDRDESVVVRQGERSILDAGGTLQGPAPFNLKTLQP